MATGSVKSHKSPTWRFPWRLIVVATALVLALTWYFWPRTSLPRQASQRLLESVINQDYDWIYEHSFPQEKELPGFTRELVKSYCEDHLSELFDAERLGGYTMYEDQPTRGMSKARLRLKNGKEVEVAALGFGEDGEMLVGSVEALMYLERNLDSELGREPDGWYAKKPWFAKHGVQTIYEAQTGNTFDLTELKPPKQTAN